MIDEIERLTGYLGFASKIYFSIHFSGTVYFSIHIQFPAYSKIFLFFFTNTLLYFFIIKYKIVVEFIKNERETTIGNCSIKEDEKGRNAN